MKGEITLRFPSNFLGEHGVLLAVSGGADSVALLRLFCEFRDSFALESNSGQFHIAVAHVNHGLRGAESDTDAVFVRNLANRLSVTYFETSLNLGENGCSEGDAREARYEFLQMLANAHAFRYIALAHHADDRVETILHRIIRGTGIAGLAGIPFSRAAGEAATIIRPLLHVKRDEILDYLEYIGQDYRLDATNLENQFTRNRIRNELLPYITNEFNPGFAESLLRLGDQAAEIRKLLEDKLESIYEETAILDPGGKTVILLLEPLRKHSRYLIRECFVRIWAENSWPLQGMGFIHWNALADAVIKPEVPPQTDFPGSIRIERTEKRLKLHKMDQG